MIPKSDLSGQTWYIWLAFTILQAVHMVLMVYKVSSSCNLSVVCNIFTEIRKIGLFLKVPQFSVPRILFWCENFSFFSYILMFSRLYIWFWWIWSPHHGANLSSSYSNFENYSFFTSSPDFMIPKSDFNCQTWYIWLAFTILQAVQKISSSF